MGERIMVVVFEHHMYMWQAKLLIESLNFKSTAYSEANKYILIYGRE